MNTIFKIIMNLIMFTFLSLFFTFCSKDEKSETKLTSPTAPIAVVIPETKINFSHSGVLHNNDGLYRIKRIVSSQTQPGFGSYEKLKNEPTASLNYQIKGPFKNIARDGFTLPLIKLTNYKRTNIKENDGVARLVIVTRMGFLLKIIHLGTITNLW
jgi:hypothetical protein